VGRCRNNTRQYLRSTASTDAQEKGLRSTTKRVDNEEKPRGRDSVENLGFKLKSQWDRNVESGQRTWRLKIWSKEDSHEKSGKRTNRPKSNPAYGSMGGGWNQYSAGPKKTPRVAKKNCRTQGDGETTS